MVTKPLSLTGAYTGGSAFGRYLETCRFWTDTTEPRGLRPGGVGRRSAVLVRTLHSMIRHTLLPHREWGRGKLGVPINQFAMWGTLLLTSFAPGQHLKRIGYRPTDADIEAMMYHQRYVGYLMGVTPRYFPTTVKEAVQLIAAFWAGQARTAGSDGVELIESYLPAFKPKGEGALTKRTRDQIHYRLEIGYARFFLSGKFYRSYDLPNAWLWAVLPPLQMPVNLTVGLLRRSSATANKLGDRYSRRRRESWWTSAMGPKESEFSARETFRR